MVTSALSTMRMTLIAESLSSSTRSQNTAVANRGLTRPAERLLSAAINGPLPGFGGQLLEEIFRSLKLMVFLINYYFPIQHQSSTCHRCHILGRPDRQDRRPCH